jgi:iron complex outermembrane recepter protein
VGFAPDSLTNNELGWKTMWLNHRIQWDGAVYQEDWDDVQIGAFTGGASNNTESTINGGNYRVRGVETFGMARATANWSKKPRFCGGTEHRSTSARSRL